MRRPKLHVGNFASWEERIDYQLRFAYDRIDRCRETDRLQASWIGELRGDVDRVRAGLERDVVGLRHSVRVLSVLVVVALVLVALLGVLVVVA